MKVPIGGGTPTTLASGQNQPIDMTVDATSVYWTTYNGGTVVKVSTSGGTPTTLASGQNAPYDIAVGAGGVYWTIAADNTVMKVPTGGGSAEHFRFRAEFSLRHRCGRHERLLDELQRRHGDEGVHQRRHPYHPRFRAEPPLRHRRGRRQRLLDEHRAGRHGDEGTHQRRHPHHPRLRAIGAIRHRSGHVECLLADRGHSGAVMKVPTSGGTPTTLASGQNLPTDIVVDASSVYWTNEGGSTVMKLTPK